MWMLKVLKINQRDEKMCTDITPYKAQLKMIKSLSGLKLSNELQYYCIKMGMSLLEHVAVRYKWKCTCSYNVSYCPQVAHVRGSCIGILQLVSSHVIAALWGPSGLNFTRKCGCCFVYVCSGVAVRQKLLQLGVGWELDRLGSSQTLSGDRISLSSKKAGMWKNDPNSRI